MKLLLWIRFQEIQMLSRILTRFFFFKTPKCWSETHWGNKTESADVRAWGFLLSLRTALAAPTLWCWEWRPSCSLKHKEWEGGVLGLGCCCKSPRVEKRKRKKTKIRGGFCCSKPTLEHDLCYPGQESHSFEIRPNFTGSSCCKLTLVLVHEWNFPQFSDTFFKEK